MLPFEKLDKIVNRLYQDIMEYDKLYIQYSKMPLFGETPDDTVAALQHAIVISRELGVILSTIVKIKAAVKMLLKDSSDKVAQKVLTSAEQQKILSTASSLGKELDDYVGIYRNHSYLINENIRGMIEVIKLTYSTDFSLNK